MLSSDIRQRRPDAFLPQPPAGTGGESRPRLGERTRAWFYERWLSLGAQGLDRRVPGTVFVAVLALAIGLIASWVSTRNGWSMLYSDAQSHLTIARRITDSKTPGFSQIGTVWLPVPHLLLLPLVQSFALWHSGWAGCLLGSACLAISTACIYRIAARLGMGRAARLTAVGVFVANPTVLYLHTTALTEPVLLATVLMTVAGLASWITSTSPFSGGELAVFAGIPAALAVLSRYDGWALAVAAAAFVFVAARRRWGSVRYALTMTSCFAALPLAAMAWWVSYNAVQFGDPLSFMRGEYSAAAQQQQLADLGLLATDGNLGLSLWTYNWLLIDVAGLGILAAAAAGAVLVIWHRGLSTTALLVWTLAAFYPFSILSLYLGQTAIRSAHSLPGGLFNIRFGVSLIPVLALLAGFAVMHAGRSRFRWTRRLAAPAVAAVVAASWLWWASGTAHERLPILAEGYVNAAGATQADDAAHWLAEHYDGGSILLDEGANPVLMKLDVPLSAVFATFNGKRFAEAVADPSGHAEWVLVDASNPADQVWSELRSDAAFAARFAQEYSAGDFRVYHRIGDPS